MYWSVGGMELRVSDFYGVAFGSIVYLHVYICKGGKVTVCAYIFLRRRRKIAGSEEKIRMNEAIFATCCADFS